MNKSLTILVFGLKKSDIQGWIKRHYYIDFSNLCVIFAYHVDDIPVTDLSQRPATIVVGPYSVWERVRLSLNQVSTDYVILAASDDQILTLPTESFDNDITAVAGNVFFCIQNVLLPSTTNSIDLRLVDTELIKSYWSYPNPGDNSLFYSIFQVKLLRNIIDGLDEFEASDWYVVHSALLAARFERSSSFVLVRQPPPRENHYTRSFLNKLKNIEPTPLNWWLHNPILYALKKIAAETPNTIIKEVEPYWARWLSVKYSELAAANPRYREFMAGKDINAVSLAVLGILAGIDRNEIISSPV
jgi:hypothetical protein